MDIVKDSDSKVGSLGPASTEDAPTREAVRTVSIGTVKRSVELSGSPNLVARGSSKYLVSEHEDESETEVHGETLRHSSVMANSLASPSAEMIPPEPAVPSDAGVDESDDESEYSYEDEDDTHFGGFLMEHQPQQPTTSTEQPAPARIEEETAAEASAAEEEEQSKKKWREPSRAAVSMSLRAEREKTGGKRRLAADLYKIMMADTEEAGFSLKPKSEDSMDKWTIKLFKFDKDSSLHKDLLALGLDHVELEMSFPDQYPFAPPFVRVVQPRFQKQTGFVMNGALCMELLTSEGWNPVNDIESVIVSIRSLLVVGEGRLQAAVEMTEPQRKAAIAAASGGDKKEDQGNEEADRPPKKQRNSTSGTAGQYSVAEAQAAYSHLSDYHKKKGWDSSGWWARKG